MLLVFHNMWSSFYFPAEANPFLVSSWCGPECPCLHQPRLWNYPCEATQDNPVSLLQASRPLWRQSRGAWPGLEPWLWPRSWWGLSFIQNLQAELAWEQAAPLSLISCFRDTRESSALNLQDLHTGFSFVASNISSILPPSGNHRLILCFYELGFSCFALFLSVPFFFFCSLPM